MRHHSLALVAGAVAVFLVFATVVACSDSDNGPTPDQSKIPETIRLSSTAFTDGSDIPPKYTCDGADLSPPLAWSNVPKGTRSLALIVDDPDARGWTYWSLTISPLTSGSSLKRLSQAVTSVKGRLWGLSLESTISSVRGMAGRAPRAERLTVTYSRSTPSMRSSLSIRSRKRISCFEPWRAIFWP